MTILCPELYPAKGLYPNFEDEARQAEADFAARGIPFVSLDQLPELKGDPRSIMLIGGGGTMNEQVGAGTRWDALNARTDVIKVVTGGTHGQLDPGKKLSGADYAIFGFASVTMAPVINPRPDITYLVALQSHPSLLDKLQASGARVLAFNGYVPSLQQNPNALIGIGSTAATAGIAVFSQLLDRKNLQLCGIDSSWRYHDGRIPTQPDEMTVPDGKGREFVVNRGFFEQQTMEIERFIAAHPDVALHFHGDSLHASRFNREQPVWQPPFGPAQDRQPS